MVWTGEAEVGRGSRRRADEYLATVGSVDNPNYASLANGK